MKLDQFIEELIKIKKARGGKLDILIYDGDNGDLLTVKSIKNPADYPWNTQKGMPENVRLDKCIEICAYE